MKTEMHNFTTPLPFTDHFASGVVLTSFTSLIFVAAFVILSLYYWKRLGRALVETRIGIVVFFLGALLTTLVSLGFYIHREIYGIYRLFLAVFIGVVFLLAGTVILFNNPSPQGVDVNDDGRPLIPVGHTNGSMGVVIWVIALPLCALEMFFAIGAATCSSPAPVYAAVKFVCLVQKLVQASIYYFSLRHKIPNPSMRMGCSWFLKTISLFNFAFWIDSIVTTHTDNAFVMKLFGHGFSIVKTSYNALTIDYRLLCSLFFLEHALEIENTGTGRHDANLYDTRIEDASSEDYYTAPVRRAFTVDVQTIHYSGYGCVIGLLCISLQLVNGLQYLNFVGSWTSIFPILCNLVIIVAGLVLVNGETALEDSNVRWRETESKAIDVMVGFMGAVGLVYRIMKSSFCLIWSFQTSSERMKSYLIWNSSKEAARAISIVFQLYFFVKVGPHFCQEARNRRRRICHFLVPTVMLTLLSIFLSCIIDQYNGKVEHFIHQSKLDPAMISFFEAAAPIHLGFSLHMFLHFYIIKRKMWRKVKFARYNSSINSTGNTESSNLEDEQRLEEPLLSIIENR